STETYTLSLHDALPIYFFIDHATEAAGGDINKVTGLVTLHAYQVERDRFGRKQEIDVFVHANRQIKATGKIITGAERNQADPNMSSMLGDSVNDLVERSVPARGNNVVAPRSDCFDVVSLGGSRLCGHVGMRRFELFNL